MITARYLLDKYKDNTIEHKELEILFDCAFSRGQMLANVAHMQWFEHELDEYLSEGIT